MSTLCLKTVVRLVLGYALCAVIPINGSLRESQNNDDPLKDYQLVFLQSMWRHGNRTQGLPYPLTVAQGLELAAPYGIGNLTPRGRREAFKLGRFFKERYGNLFPPHYTSSSTSLVCTEPTRTQETSWTAMAALFPPTGPQLWQDQGLGSEWTPVTCQYTPAKEDKIYTPYMNCTRLVELLVLQLDTPLFRAEVARLTQFGLLNEYVAINAGTPSVNDIGLLFYFDLFSTLEGNGQPIPNWARRVYPEPLRSVYGLYLNAFYSTPELAKIMTGPFWKLTLDLADDLERGTLTPKDRVFYGYSLHDVNVGSIITTLKPKNIARPVPPFTAAIMIEWYRYNWDPSRIALKFIYRYDTHQDLLLTLDITGCGEVCPLDKFRELVKEYLLDQSADVYCLGQSILAPAELEMYSQIIGLWAPPENQW